MYTNWIRTCHSTKQLFPTIRAKWFAWATDFISCSDHLTSEWWQLKSIAALVLVLISEYKLAHAPAWSGPRTIAKVLRTRGLYWTYQGPWIYHKFGWKRTVRGFKFWEYFHLKVQSKYELYYSDRVWTNWFKIFSKHIFEDKLFYKYVCSVV